ncbi:MAG: thioredoxin [bacterium]
MGEIQVTDANFETEVLQNDGIVLVDFWAPRCGPCKRLSPIIDELAQENEGKLKVCKLNTDDASATAAKYQIASIPTLIIFKGGKPYEQMVGLRTKADIQEKINQLIS